MSKIVPKQIFGMLISAFIIFATFIANAQDGAKTIGNKPRSGSANSSFNVVRGNQVGIRIRAGRRPVQLLKLNFGAENNFKDSLGFKVNVYQFNSGEPGENFVKQDIPGTIPTGKHRITVDLAPYHLNVSGTILVTIEWLKTASGAYTNFPIGFFNGGTYYYKYDQWKKIPIVGVDFNLLVRKLKTNS